MKVDRPFGIAVAMAAVVVVIGLVLWVGANPDTVRADTSAPAAPANLELTLSWSSSGDGEGMKLSWTAPEGTITGYQILRQRSGCDTDLQVYGEDTGSVATTYTDADAVAGVTYVYRVKAINSGTVGAQSDSATGRYHGSRSSQLGSFVPGAPRMPSGLDSSNLRVGIELTWEAPSYGEVTGYQILRRLPEECERMQVYVENTNSSDTRWIDTDVEDGTLYEYRVAAINDAGTGYRSSPTKFRKLIPEPEREVWPFLIMSYPFNWVFPNSTRSLTFSVNVHALGGDGDPDTVDFTLRGDVTLDTDGSDADDCEHDELGEVDPDLLRFGYRAVRLGEDIQINVVDEPSGHFQATFGGSGCSTAGTYGLTFFMTNRDGEEVTFGPFEFLVIGPAISGTAQVGETLTADISSFSNADNHTNATFSYRWYANDGTGYSAIPGATGSTYTLDSSDVGKAIKVRLRVWNDVGELTVMYSPATAAVTAANNSATGAPTITGTARVGETLTASTTGTSDSDGLTNASFTHQWLADDTEISGATSSAYTLVAADQGKAIKVSVSFNDDRGNAETLTSAATSAVAVAQQLTATVHNPPDSHDGSAAFTFELRFSEELPISYATLRDHAFTVIGGEVVNARRLERPANVRWGISVRPSGNADVTVSLPATTDCDSQGAICTGDGRKLASALEVTVSVQNFAATGAPAITGTARVGETLTASTTGISDANGRTNATYTYQWLADDAEISSATGSGYTLVAADEGKAIKVQVSFTDDAGNAETLTSTATSAVAASAPTVIPDEDEEEQEQQQATPLTATIHDAPESHDGSSVFTFELRLSEEFGISYKTLRDHAFTVTGGEVIKARRLERGKNLRWEISVTPGGNGDITVVLPATTDCSVQGAICTEDGRKLSNRVEVTVPGPVINE